MKSVSADEYVGVCIYVHACVCMCAFACLSTCPNMTHSLRVDPSHRWFKSNV